MTERNIALERARQEIDEIDTAIHDLILRRTEVVAEVGRAKGGTSTANFAPGREAKVIRRRMDHHKGSFPRVAISRIWREMISVFAAMQGPLVVAAYADGDDQGCWDLARDQYGCHDRMMSLSSIRGVIAQVFSRDAAVGVVPVPVNDGSVDCWWRSLCVADAPRVVQRLPFVNGSNARNGAIDAFAVSHVLLDDSGDDRSLIVIETSEQMHQDTLRTLLEKAGLSAESIVSRHEDVWVHLADVAGFLTTDGPELKMLEGEEAILRACSIGGYAVPVTDTESGA